MRAQQLLEHSLLGELRAIVARALSGLDMFAGSGLSELDLLPTESTSVEILSVRHLLHVPVRQSPVACVTSRTLMFSFNPSSASVNWKCCVRDSVERVCCFDLLSSVSVSYSRKCLFPISRRIKMEVANTHSPYSPITCLGVGGLSQLEQCTAAYEFIRWCCVLTVVVSDRIQRH